MADIPVDQDGENTQDKVIAFPRDTEWVPMSHVRDERVCSADDVLQAQMGELKNVVLIGESEDGGLVLSSTMSRRSDINYMLDVAKTWITGVTLE